MWRDVVEQPWYLSPAGWLLELGSAMHGADAAPHLPLALPGIDTTARLGTGSIERLFDTLKTQVTGKRIETTLGDKPVAFTIDDIDARFDRFGAAMGQVNGLSLTAFEPVFDGLHARRFTVSAHNVHTRPSINPIVVAAPLEVVVVADWPQATALLKHYADKVEIEPLGEQRLRVRYNGTRTRNGWVDTRLVSEGGRIELRPLAAGWGRWLRRGGLTAISSIPIATAVTDGVRVVDLTVDSETVTVVLRIDEMSIPYRKLLAYTPEQHGRRSTE